MSQNHLVQECSNMTGFFGGNRLCLCPLSEVVGEGNTIPIALAGDWQLNEINTHFAPGIAHWDRMEGRCRFVKFPL